MTHFHICFILSLFISSSFSIDVNNLGKSQIPILTAEICDKKPEIEEITLLSANITKIETNALHKCNRVVKIWLEDNLLTDLFSETFKNKPKLRELNLRRNRLEYLDEDVFDGLAALETLNLQCNKLIFFSSRHTQDLMLLKYLNIASNHLINLEINELLAKLPQLGFINYNGNDISCARHAVISAKINASGVGMGDAHCDGIRSVDLIESESPQYTAEPYFCMPDDKWDLRSTEVIARIDELKQRKKYETKK
ncbi:carboxypeptidase N subunit 2-like [Culicoides brevitarsis]|uniref:carboxypeptidase N subunit 2-like n=1 Tax=Culicoides brevitarsis TaxID=469753 RepID=UPI00307B5B09